MDADGGNQTWTVLEFKDSKTVEAVPSTWIIGTKCYWPPTANRDKLQSEIKKCNVPNEKWPLYNVRLFKEAIYDTYFLAREKAKKAEDTSDLNSDNECMKKRTVRPKKMYSSSDDETLESLLPVPPKISEKFLANKKDKPNNCNQKEETIPETFNKDAVSQSLLNVRTKGPGSSIASSLQESSTSICKNCEGYQKRNELFFNQIINKQSLMKAQLLQVAEDVNRIIKMLEKTQLVVDENSFLKTFEFPINDQKQFEDLSVYLSEDINFQRAAKELSNLGGTTAYEYVRRCLSELMTNELASKYSFFGLKGKATFKGLRIWDVIKDSGNFDVASIEDGAKKWLRRAKERAAYQKKNVQM